MANTIKLRLLKIGCHLAKTSDEDVAEIFLHNDLGSTCPQAGEWEYLKRNILGACLFAHILPRSQAQTELEFNLLVKRDKNNVFLLNQHVACNRLVAWQLIKRSRFRLRGNTGVSTHITIFNVFIQDLVNIWRKTDYSKLSCQPRCGIENV